MPRPTGFSDQTPKPLVEFHHRDEPIAISQRRALDFRIAFGTGVCTENLIRFDDVVESLTRESTQAVDVLERELVHIGCAFSHVVAGGNRPASSTASRLG
jgi:hypothetical protein